ncbi:MAG: hypothetical protein ACJ8AT_31600 [Hyalangium sp.]|uniref:hypothetical protein n=1 Tax=Hyalangium sp. TaxID=2028555 RepID=UPI00389A2A3F
MTKPTSPKPPTNPCEHPSFTKERINGAQTGDYTCDQCRNVFSWGEKLEIEEARKKK